MAHLSRSLAWSATAASSLALLLGAWACSSEPGPPDPGGNDNYGADYIGYKNDIAASEAATGVASSGAIGDSAAGAGATTGAYLPGAGGFSTGGTTGSGASFNFGGMTFDSASWTGPERGPAPEENPFFAAGDDAVSTFSIDVDTGSYTLARNAIDAGELPARDEVRIEEFLNYFHFHYAEPTGERPLSLYTEISEAPWNPQRELLLLGVQGKELKVDEQPPMNLVFLVDVSGSMSAVNKLPLLQRGLRMLTRQLRPEDRVSLVTYASSDRVILDGVSGSRRDDIDDAIADLHAGGSTNGESGIAKAYQLAQKHFIEGGTNRVLLGTDGDFNVGLSGTEELTSFIAKKRDTGVFLSVYGFGDSHLGGNFQDEVAEQLADNGNGVYFFIDSEEEARRAFIHTVSGSLITVAKDVKLQVEFNPKHVKAYRLIGYENRVLSDVAFSDDSVDAGELGAGLSVTALYEIIPADSSEAIPEAMEGTIPDSVRQAESEASNDGEFPELEATDYVQVRMRYKESDSNTSDLFVVTRGVDQKRPLPSHKMSFAAGVVEFAQLLRGSQYLSVAREQALVNQIDDTRALDKEGAIEEVKNLVADGVRLAH